MQESVSQPQVDFPLYFDSSMLEAVKTCPRKGYYSYLRHLKPTEGNVHLTAGAAFAAGIEEVRKSYYSPTSSCHRDLQTSLSRGIKKVFEEYGDFNPLNSPKSPERVAEALVEYFHVWHPEKDSLQPLMKNDGEPAVEITFALPLGVLHPVTGEELLYVGRYDMLGLFQGTTWVCDEKTASRLGQQWRDQWDLRSQFTGYCWAAVEHGFPVAGAIVRGVSFLKNSYGTEEAITHRPSHMIYDWLRSTRYYLEQLKMMWKESFYPQELGSACTNYSGCEFKLLCTRKDPEHWVKDNFVVSPWDPLAQNKIKTV